jgi:hypothetical protein
VCAGQRFARSVLRPVLQTRKEEVSREIAERLCKEALRTLKEEASAAQPSRKQDHAHEEE